jgi:molecular chaperone DnaK
MWSWLWRTFRRGPDAPQLTTASRPGQRSSSTPELILGIDLGSAYCAAAVVIDGSVRVIRTAEGESLTPSVVARTLAGDWLVGTAALRQAVYNPAGTVFGLKNLLGKRQRDLPTHDPFGAPTAAGLDDWALVVLHGERYPPSQLAARLLRQLRTDAERELGLPVRRAVLALPVDFDSEQRQALLDAARIAGFDPEWDWTDPESGKRHRLAMRLVYEPVAATLAHMANRPRSACILVLDLGSAHCGCAVVDSGDGLGVVLAVGGTAGLGAEALDRWLLDQVADSFLKRQGIDLRRDPLACVRLREAVTQVRKDLSQQQESVLDVPYLAGPDGQFFHLQAAVTRGQYERLVQPLLDRGLQVARTALEGAQRKPDQIDAVLLVGGLARLPRWQAMVRELFGREPSLALHPDEAVAAGAALAGAHLLLGSRAQLVLVAAAPCTLGLEIEGGKIESMIRRYTALPCSHRYVVSTPQDRQTELHLRVYQGEGTTTTAPGVRLIGAFVVTNLTPLPRGQLQVEVEFTLAEPGRLTIAAHELPAGQRRTFEVIGRSALTASDVERLFHEAEDQARADLRRGELVQARDRAAQQTREVDDLLARHASILTPADRAPLAKLVEQTRQVAQGEDVQALREALLELERALEGFTQYLERRHQLHGIAAAPLRQTAITRIDLDWQVPAQDFAARIEKPDME